MAGFYFIAELGVERSFQIAAATNIAIGVIAVIASYLIPGTGSPAPAPSEHRTARSKAPYAHGTSASTLVLWVFFVSGVMSLALEIIWFRMLVVFLRPTAYAFTIMLACVLAGIAIGSAIAAPILRMRSNWLPALAVDPGADWRRRRPLLQRADAIATSHRRRHAVVRSARTRHLPGAARGVEHDCDAAHDDPAGPRLPDRPDAMGGRRARRRHQPPRRRVLFAQRLRRDSRLGGRRLRAAAASSAAAGA